MAYRPFNEGAEESTRQAAVLMVERDATIIQASQFVGVPRATLHYRLRVLLPKTDNFLYLQVDRVLVRHRRCPPHYLIRSSKRR